jgi:hypothetical protein
MYLRHIVLIGLFASFLVSCDSGGAAVPVQPPPPPLPTSAEKISDLEASGKLPKLDRSADIKGPDVDTNGIRDDIDAFISSQNYSSSQKTSLRQLAKVHQRSLTINTADKTALDGLQLDVARAVDCVFESFPEAPDPALAGIVATNIRNITLNTKARMLAGLAVSKAVDGTVLPSPEGNSCD